MCHKFFYFNENLHIEVVTVNENEKEYYDLRINKTDEETEYYTFNDYYELLTNLWGLEERFYNILQESETDRTEEELDRLIELEVVKQEDKEIIMKYRKFVETQI